MRRSISVPLPALLCSLLLLLGSGCAPAISSPAATAEASSMHAAEAPATGTVSSEAWAAAIYKACGARKGEVKSTCYEGELLSLLGAEGVGTAMAVLDLLGRHDGDVQHLGHVFAHGIGIAAYTSREEVGSVFAQCTPVHQSGCYHGVIQAYFSDLTASSPHPRVTAEETNQLCVAYRDAGASRWLLFQCAHGMGHGLVALHDRDLPRALEGCDLLNDSWEREGCYGGAFMENLVHATMPHHGPSTGAHGAAHETANSESAAAHAAHVDHGHEHAEHHHAEAVAERTPFRALDPADPHHPCSAIGARYQNACYTMQTSAVLFYSNGNVAAGVELCETAPTDVQHTCYGSLGRDISAYTNGRPSGAIEKCALAPEPHRPWCYVGFAKHRVDLTADAADGLAFCRQVPKAQSRVRCFEAVGEQIEILEFELPRREALCHGLDERDAQACRRGAGLPEASAASRPTTTR